MTRPCVLNDRATAILWALRLRFDGIMPREQYDTFTARERAGAPVNELLAELAELDPTTALKLAADLAVNAEGGSA